MTTEYCSGVHASVEDIVACKDCNEAIDYLHDHYFEPQLSSEDYDNPVYQCECGATKD